MKGKEDWIKWGRQYAVYGFMLGLIVGFIAGRL